MMEVLDPFLVSEGDKSFFLLPRLWKWGKYRLQINPNTSDMDYKEREIQV